MGQQLQANGGEDFITIRGELQNFSSLKVSTFQVVIKDEYAVASFSENNLAKKMVKDEVRHGNINIKYSAVIDSAIEHYPRKTKEYIAKVVAKKLKDGGAKLQ